MTVVPEAIVHPVKDVSVEWLKRKIVEHLSHEVARSPNRATGQDWWRAVARTVQDLSLEHLLETAAKHRGANTRRVYYLSLEYLMGRMLSNNLHNLGIFTMVEQALNDLGQDFEVIHNEEYDMGLGNGGLGRLAACFLDSMATLDLPAIGYGIRYEFGLFRQEFENGHQIEHPDAWLSFDNIWDVCHPEYSQKVSLYGHVEHVFDDRGRYRPQWKSGKEVVGVPHDIPVIGYGARTVNFLRLWRAQSSNDLDLALFNEGGYVEAMRSQIESEAISKVLYPNDKTENGKELRLAQQYFFVTCSLRDIIRRHFNDEENSWENFSDKAVVQLNDTHPAIAIAELMRILHDETDMAWDKAWGIITKVFAYTNHTLLPEALESWSVPLLTRVLPRHMEIIFEINRHFMTKVDAHWPGDSAKKAHLSLIAEGHTQMVRMANMAVVGSFSVNGVAAIHSQLLKTRLFPEFNEFYPGKFNNKTNGITPRRWLQGINPRLSKLITGRIGAGWVHQQRELRRLEPLADDPEFQEEFMAVKRANKVVLAERILKECGVVVSPDALFDVQIKRLHEYKRQHLNLLHILTLYKRLLDNPDEDLVPRVFIFGAKAAPGYELAKTIIKAINAVGEVINNDERIQDKLKVVFLPNYRVSLASVIIPASDLSEQISTAGKEASGTGNMKLALNGSLTIGTLDGANIEIGEEVGEDHIFIFGNTVDQVDEIRAAGYNPWTYYDSDKMLRTVVDWVGSNYFTPDEPGVLHPLRRSLLDNGDPFMVLADYAEYVKAQERVDVAYRDKKAWAKSAILNTARMDKFSSDRTISEYANEIWNVKGFKG